MTKIRDLFSKLEDKNKDIGEDRDLAERYLSMEISELAEDIERHDALYFRDNKPSIPDFLYDRLKERLRELDAQHPLLTRVEPATLEGKVLHERPMLSLDKAYDFGKIRDWYAKFEGAALGSPKIDGLACSIRYDENGELILAATRGDGLRGEEITNNVLYIEVVPPKILAKSIEVRGEIFMPLSAFEKYKDQFANPRNLAAGGVKLKNAQETAAYGLRFFAYDLLGEAWESESKKWARLNELGFETAPSEVVQATQVESYCDRLLHERDSYDYETDGIVFKVEQVSEQERLGHTSHHPRYGIAFKFQGDSSSSTLLGVDWQVSRSGAITPVAHVEPVVLSGAKVTKASLHNLAVMEKLALGYGDIVEMTRRGGVIPHLEKVLKHLGEKIEIPDHCPSCGAQAERRADFLYCSKPENCMRGRAARLEHFAKVIDAKGFGTKIINQLMELDYLHSPEDFFDLQLEHLMQIGRERSSDAKSKSDVLAKKLYESVQNARKVTLQQFLQALGIEGLGRSQSLVIAKHFGNLDAILSANIHDFMQIEGFAQITATALYEGLRERLETIEALRHEMHILQEQEVPRESLELPLAGKSFLFTGELKSMKRKEAEAKVEALGATIASGVSKKLSVLVAASQGHGKWQRAVKLNAEGAEIDLWDEARFLELLGMTELDLEEKL
ncbi:MAG: NAD-dependent DNA ligase LigA [Bradymonadales bacterium]